MEISDEKYKKIREFEDFLKAIFGVKGNVNYRGGCTVILTKGERYKATIYEIDDKKNGKFQITISSIKPSK